MKSKECNKWLNGDEIRLMVRAEGWCMVRRKGCMPYVIQEKFWDRLMDAEEGRKVHQQYKEALSK